MKIETHPWVSKSLKSNQPYFDYTRNHRVFILLLMQKVWSSLLTNLNKSTGVDKVTAVSCKNIKLGRLYPIKHSYFQKENPVYFFTVDNTHKNFRKVPNSLLSSDSYSSLTKNNSNFWFNTNIITWWIGRKGDFFSVGLNFYTVG